MQTLILIGVASVVEQFGYLVHVCGMLAVAGAVDSQILAHQNRITIVTDDLVHEVIAEDWLQKFVGIETVILRIGNDLQEQSHSILELLQVGRLQETRFLK